MFTDEARVQFGVEPVVSSEMNQAILTWMNIYRGQPLWVDEEDDIRTINFAKSICEETARLTTLAIDVKISGGARAKWLQEQIDKAIAPRLRGWVEYGCAGGTVIFKPNGSGIDVVTPDRFMVTEQDSNKKITGVIFQDSYTVGKKIYNKLEYHRFKKMRVYAEAEPTERTLYLISTKTYESDNTADIGREIPITSTRWSGIQPEVAIEKQKGDRLDAPMFGVFTMPAANNIDLDSPLGLSIFSQALEEMKDLDIAYSRNSAEIYDSQTIELIDDALLQVDGKNAKKATLPRHVHNVFGNGVETFYQQIQRPLNTAARIAGMDQQLSLIGYKCGFSNGYFVFDQKTGMVTATQVEADDRRTIQLIKDIRDNLKAALEDVIYAMTVFADLYDLAPVGDYTVDFDFGDITYNEDEDRNRNYQLMMQGIIPKWYYLVKFEGMGEDEAKKIVQEADEAGAARAQLFAAASEE